MEHAAAVRALELSVTNSAPTSGTQMRWSTVPPISMASVPMNPVKRYPAPKMATPGIQSPLRERLRT